jgi:hypothetical protein
MHIARSLTLLATLCALLGAGGALASTADSASKAETATRKATYVDNCVRCEARACARDAARPTAAHAQATAAHAACAPQLGMRYFPAEEQHLAAYLDQQRCRPD